MAEEVQNAAVNVPRAMFFTIFINGAFVSVLGAIDFLNLICDYGICL
jgi:hypothetical protein